MHLEVRFGGGGIELLLPPLLLTYNVFNMSVYERFFIYRK